MAGAQASPRLKSLYYRARICQTFPAYRLDELERMPIRDLLQAMELLSIARQVNS